MTTETLKNGFTPEEWAWVSMLQCFRGAMHEGGKHCVVSLVRNNQQFNDYARATREVYMQALRMAPEKVQAELPYYDEDGLKKPPPSPTGKVY